VILSGFVLSGARFASFLAGKIEIVSGGIGLRASENHGFGGERPMMARARHAAWFFCDSFLKKYFHFAF
jgi:hypothetical protein